jgi:hypothetical protein
MMQFAAEGWQARRRLNSAGVYASLLRFQDERNGVGAGSPSRSEVSVDPQRKSQAGSESQPHQVDFVRLNLNAN